MAADTKTKTVEYVIRGNTVNLEQQITRAIKIADDLQTKLARVAMVGKASGSLESATGISKNINSLSAIKQRLTDIPNNISADQVNLVASATNTLEKANARLKDTSTGTVRTMRSLGTSLKNVKKGLNEVDTASQSTISSLGGIFAKGYILYRLLTLLVTKIKEGISSAMDYAETVNLFNVAAGDSAEVLGDFATKFATAYSADPNEILKYVGTFNLLTTSIGGTSKQAEVLSENATKLSYDLASLFNTDVDTMATAVRSGLTGVSKPLKKYGIVINDTVVKQQAAMMGITKSWDSMAEVDKMGLRYITMLEQASKSQGDLARTLESPQNQFKILKAQADIFFRSLGSVVLIVGKIVLPVINGILIGVNSLLQTFTSAAGYVIPNFANSMTNSTGALEDEEEAANSLNKALKKVLMPFDELNVMSKDTGTATFAMDPQIEEALKGYDNLMSNIQSKAALIGDSVKRALDPAMLEGFGAAAKLAFDLFGVGVTIALGALSALSYPLSWLTKAIGWLLTPIKGIVDGWNSADKATRAWARAGGIALGVLGSLIVAYKAYNVLTALGNGNLLKGIKFLYEYTAAGLKNVAMKIKDIVVTKAQAIAQWWHNASLAAKIMLVSAGLAVGVIAAAGIAAAVMSAKSKQTESSVPGLAAGGVVTSPTLALVGEGKYNEAVVPLDNSPQFSNMKAEIAAAVAEKVGGAGGNISVYVQIGERDFKNYVYKIVNDQNKSNTGISLEKLSAVAQRGM